MKNRDLNNRLANAAFINTPLMNTFTKTLRVFFALFALFTSMRAISQQDGVIILSDTVTGNQEQPKVLYIVPWQAAHDNTMLKAELVTKLQNDVFAHIERPEHKRQLQFIQQLTQTDTEDSE